MTMCAYCYGIFSNEISIKNKIKNNIMYVQHVFVLNYSTYFFSFTALQINNYKYIAVFDNISFNIMK